MPRLYSLCFPLTWLLLVGCDRGDSNTSGSTTAPATQAATSAPAAWDRARQAVQSAGSRLTAEYEESHVLAHAQGFFRAVDDRDLESLRRLCAVGDETAGEYGAILGDYYHAFAIENGEGPDAARARLAEGLATPGLSPARAKALKGLDAYLEAKGSLRTREAAGLILVLAFECKYPGYGGRIASVMAKRVGLVDLGPSADLPSLSPATAPGTAPGNEPPTPPDPGTR